jgi:hypothetical protein
MAKPKDDKWITVCSECLRASCWQGEFYCDDYMDAGIVEKRRSELALLKRESPHYWERDG